MVQQEGQNIITVVSGLPRSGTSMMMKMLSEGGMSTLTDNIRTRDVHNPAGYYEYESVRKLPYGQTEWLDMAAGKAVKIIAGLLEYLPAEYSYKVIFMERHIQEIVASQKKLIEFRKESISMNDDQLFNMVSEHVRKVKAWLRVKSTFSVLDVNYNATILDPATVVSLVNKFLGGWLDEVAMVNAVRPDLYRNRK